MHAAHPYRRPPTHRLRILWLKLTRPWASLQAGQATAEYALVLLAVAAIALALTTWAGGGKIASFFDAVFDRLLASTR